MNRAKSVSLTIKTLQREGVPVMSGHSFFSKKFLTKKAPSLADVRRRLAKFKGSLAEEVARIRETE